MEKFYRVMVNGKGIYEVVDHDCPKGDKRREGKPDGSWLNKIGPDFPGAISFWTEEGFKKYKESGLYDWHKSVVKGEVEIKIISRPKEILHEDLYRIILNPN